MPNLGQFGYSVITETLRVFTDSSHEDRFEYHSYNPTVALSNHEQLNLWRLNPSEYQFSPALVGTSISSSPSPSRSLRPNFNSKEVTKSSSSVETTSAHPSQRAVKPSQVRLSFDLLSGLH